MKHFVLCLAVALAQTGLAAEAASPAPVQPPRSYADISRQLRDLLRDEAQADTNSQRAAALAGMCDLFTELRLDSRLAASDTLTRYKTQLWSRLNRAQRELRYELRERDGTRPTGEPTASNTATRELDALPLQLADAIHQAQTTALLAGAAGAGPGAHLVAASGSAGGRAGAPDWGPELVELIQRTISPEFWDVQGGPGTIVYYYPLRVLVVRATSELHHEIGETLGALRRAGQ